MNRVTNDPDHAGYQRIHTSPSHQNHADALTNHTHSNQHSPRLTTRSSKQDLQNINATASYVSSQQRVSHLGSIKQVDSVATPIVMEITDDKTPNQEHTSPHKDDQNKSGVMHQTYDKNRTNDLTTEIGAEKVKQLFQNKVAMKKSTCCGRLFFTWVTPLINFTKKNGSLQFEQLGNLPAEDRVEVDLEKLEQAWLLRKNQGLRKNSLVAAIFASFKNDYLYLFTLNAVQSVLTLLGPFFINFLVQFVKTGENPIEEYVPFFDTSGVQNLTWLTPQLQYGISLALLLVISQAISYILTEYTSFKQQMIGAKSTNALIGLIFNKQLKLSSATNKDFSQGEIITFVQVDSQKMQWLSQQLPLVATFPFTLILGFSMLFYYLGFSFFAGIGVFVMSFYTNIFISRRLARIQKAYMKTKGQRVSITTEVVNNIKVIKLNGWTEFFREHIDKARQVEMQLYLKKVIILIFMVTLVNFFPSFLQAVCFTVYIGTDHRISLADAYTVTSTINIIGAPIRVLPLFLGQVIEFSVAMRRIQTFLACEEINSTLINKQTLKSQDRPNMDLEQEKQIAQMQNLALRINKQANFHWGVDQPKKDAKSKGRGPPGVNAQHKNIIEQRKEGSAKKLRNSKSKKRESESESAHQNDTQTVKDLMALKNLDLEINRGEFVCLIGDVGSGKSSLLSALLGDLQFLPNKEYALVQNDLLKEQHTKDKLNNCSKIQHQEGFNPIEINGTTSYVQQTPWIQNKTIRENICFGMPFESSKYHRVIKICELTRDLEILPAGDMTEIGEKGINLSGGQKARISLARAVYSERDIILMDDPISALDANVKKLIFQNVFVGELRNKTRVLVTHAVDFLHLVDRVVILKEGEVVLSGSYDQLQNDPYMKQLMSIFQGHKEEQRDLIQKQMIERESKKVIEVEDKDEDEEQELLQRSKINADLANEPADPNQDPAQENQTLGDQSFYSFKNEQQPSEKGGQDQDKIVRPNNKVIMTQEELVQSQREKQIKIKSKKLGKITTNEEEEKVSVSFAIYKKFFLTYYGWSWIFCVIFTMLLFTGTNILNDYLIGAWANDVNQYEDFWKYSPFVIGFTFVLALTFCLRSCTNQGWTRIAVKRLHRQMINRVMEAPVNLYFDVTPVGRIMNKFSKDLNAIESTQGFMMSMIMQNFFRLIQVFLVAIVAVYWIGAILPFVLFIAFYLVNRVVPSIRETVRINSTTKSPLLSYLGESISGATTIRAFELSAEFIKGNNVLLNQNILATQMQTGVQGWFAIRVDFLAVGIMLMFSLICISVRERVNSIILSLLLVYLLQIQVTMIQFLRTFMLIQQNMVNAHRCMVLCEIIQENSKGTKSAVKQLKQRQNWPESGHIQFQNVQLKYRPTTELVLHDLTFEVKAGEKIGVVGRTGAGKSTIAISISRIVELFSGKIMLDGIDIAEVPIHELRKRITVIPQDPVLFTGTLRFNIDPLDQSTDDEIIQILEQAQLQNVLNQDPKGLLQNVSENGQNYSSGERQLICICRAILRKSSIVILDEATANIDMLTEQKIQRLIETSFTQSTMLTIAHRLNTIIKSDKILVLSFGRVKEFGSPQELMMDEHSEFSKLLEELKKEQEQS